MYARAASSSITRIRFFITKTPARNRLRSGRRGTHRETQKAGTGGGTADRRFPGSSSLLSRLGIVPVSTRGLPAPTDPTLLILSDTDIPRGVCESVFTHGTPL